MADEIEQLKTQNKESLPITEQTIKENTRGELAEDLDLDKEKIMKELEKAKNAEKRVKLFAKLTDKYCLEAIA